MARPTRTPRAAGDPTFGRERIDPYKPPGAEPSGTQWASGINLLLGVWLIIAPWALGYSGDDSAVWNEVLVGTAIGLVALARINEPRNWASLSLINVVLGAWLIVAPFLLSYDATTDRDAIYWNDILVGTAVVVLALLSRAGAGRRPPAPAAEEYHEK